MKKRNNNYYNFENKNLLQYSVSEREIKEHQEKISNIVKQNETTYGVNWANGKGNSIGQPVAHSRMTKLVETPELLPKHYNLKKNEFNSEIYQKEIMSLIKNQNFQEIRFRKSPLEEHTSFNLKGGVHSQEEEHSFSVKLSSQVERMN